MKKTIVAFLLMVLAVLFSSCAGAGGGTTRPVTTVPTRLTEDQSLAVTSLSLSDLTETDSLFLELRSCTMLYEHTAGEETACLTVFVYHAASAQHSSADACAEVRIYRIAPDLAALLSGESVAVSSAFVNTGNSVDMMILDGRIRTRAEARTGEGSFSDERAAVCLLDGVPRLLTEDPDDAVFSLMETLAEFRGTGKQYFDLPG